MREFAVLLILLFEILDEISELLLLGRERGSFQVLDIFEIVINFDKSALSVPALVDIFFLDRIELAVEGDLFLAFEEHRAHALLVVRLGFRSWAQEAFR